VNIDPTAFEAPLRWRRPLRVFVNSMSDLFQDAVPDEVISQIWSVMRNARWHTFQILTKRPERMRELLSHRYFRLPNVWLGTSVESSSYLDRIDVLRLVPARVRFVSFEPLLGVTTRKCSECTTLERSMNGLRAGMADPSLMAAARVAAGVTSLTCQEPTLTGPLPNRRSRPKAEARLTAAWCQTCTRHVGRVIALSIEPFYNPSGRSSIGLRAAPITAIVTADVVGYAHAVYEQIYNSSLMPRTYLCARLLETLD